MVHDPAIASTWDTLRLGVLEVETNLSHLSAVFGKVQAETRIYSIVLYYSTINTGQYNAVQTLFCRCQKR